MKDDKGMSEQMTIGNGVTPVTSLDDAINARVEGKGKTHMSKADKTRLLTSLSSPDDIALAEHARETFVRVWKDVVLPSGRTNADKMLAYLDGGSCDFFIAPSSSRYHGATIGGLVRHSLNVYWCLMDILADGGLYDKMGIRPSEDSIAVIALLHDLCKANFYSVESRNRKNARGQWEPYPFFSYDDSFPYGHGEKSAFMVSKIMPISTEEDVAIRFHMGFSNCNDQTQRGYFSSMVTEYPLCLAVNEADTRAALLLE